MTSVRLTAATREGARHDLNSRTTRNARLLILLPLLALLIFFATGFTHNFIPSESMEPNLRPGDHIITMRAWLAYPGGAMPARGDIIVFHLPQPSESPEPAGSDNGIVDAATRGKSDPNPVASSGKSDVLIKRVVGLPGDEIQVKANVVYVNGKPLKESYAIVPVEDSDGYEFRYAVDEPLRVPQGQLFVLGDNRGNSDDGRFWGTLPRANVMGRCVRVLYHESKYDLSEAALPTRRE